MRITIRYVEGDELTIDPERWASVRGDGVDWFEVTTERGTTRFSGDSIYWLYEHDGVWYAGGCGVGYVNRSAISELVIKDGEESTRSHDYVPDLHHAEVKLGWWWPE
jgi:hypothetical protein